MDIRANESASLPQVNYGGFTVQQPNPEGRVINVLNQPGKTHNLSQYQPLDATSSGYNPH